MLYAYQMRAHSNARYQQSLLSLAQKELCCMLSACGIQTEVCPHTLGGTPFLCFEAPDLTPDQRAFLTGHSALYMTAFLEAEGLLRPVEGPPASWLPDDMPEILKYKVKTNAAFTRMLLNLALSAGGQWNARGVRTLDPICGRGTALYCALGRGMDAMGIDSDRKSIQEGIAFTRKWLQFHHIKHTVAQSSYTLPGGKSAPGTVISIRRPEAEKPCDMTFLLADTRNTAALTRRQRVHALTADLPYGVQHAPREHGRMDSLPSLLRDCLPAWRQALLPGCAAAIAFNTYTLPRETLEKAALDAGFILPPEPIYHDFSHWVEQAVNRDVLIARNPDQ